MTTRGFVRFKTLEASRLATCAWNTLRDDGPSHVLTRVVRWCQNTMIQLKYEAKYGVDTARMVGVQDLSASGSNLSNAYEYSPSAPVPFNAVLHTLPINYSEYTFVDLGSGKGLAVILASELNFEQIIGVEFAKNVYEIAVANLQLVRRRTPAVDRIRLILDDAAEYMFPQKPLVLYLFNPFGREVVIRVIANLRASLAADPRTCWIVYMNPVHHELFAHSEFLKTHVASMDRRSAAPYCVYCFVPTGA